MKFLGTGEGLHDTNYEHLAISSMLNDLRSFAIKNSSYSGIPINEEYCPFHVTVYPSHKMRIDYNTTDRIIFPVICVVIFAFTSMIFVIYDWHVRQRQQRLLKTALDKSFNCNILELMVKDRTRELEHTNKKLAEANKALIQSSKKQLQHFACMSHEIRTPLNSIIGYASLLVDNENLDSMQKESISTIVSSGDLLLSIVNDVLDYSKLETGNVDIELNPTNLKELVDVVVRTMTNKAQSTSLKLQCTYDTTQLPNYIETDSFRLQQVLYNLISNACKFSKEGGTVEIDVGVASSWYNAFGENVDCYNPPNEIDNSQRSSERDHPLATSTRSSIDGGDQQGGEQQQTTTTKVLRFTVKDYGKGICRSDFQKIFLPFLQGGSEDESIYGGSGLGLAITSKLVHRLGGEIYVESEESKWTKFTAEFPLNESCKQQLETLVNNVSATSTPPLFTTTRRPSYTPTRRTSSKLEEQVAQLLSSTCGNNDDDVTTTPPTAAEATTASTVVPSCSSMSATTVTTTPAAEDPQVETVVEVVEEVTPPNGSPCKSETPVVTTSKLKEEQQPPLFNGEAKKETPQDVEEEETQEKKVVPYSELNILIAEDNKVNQKVLLRMLNRLGATKVVIVENGKDAVEREMQERFDVVLMDMQVCTMYTLLFMPNER